MKSLLFFLLLLLAGLFIFVGLPLLGWGLGDVPHFLDNPARVAYVLVIFLLQLFAVVYLPQPIRRKEQRKSGVPEHKVDLYLIQILRLAIVLLAPFSDQRAIGTLTIGDGVRFIGIILLVSGFLLIQIAEKYLDTQFSVEVTLQDDHKLIQGGPYKFVRHPRYLGMLVFFLGISITFRSLFAIILVIALALVLVWRISVEEDLIRQEFGKEWDDYCAKTWRIIPILF
ncbi:MAG: isoprenylcysteine carboxylmethyltransferase family protein [Chloroflexi bacterium]|nr:isoprenylcysteine carboxylmethyltransferase family protein [Chloroflexota bacterium]